MFSSCSSNVSSLSRGSVTPLSCPPPTTVSSSLAMSKPWTGPTPQLSPAPPRPTPPLHSSFPPPMFTAPLPPVSRASPLTSAVQPPNPNPFSAESLFQTSQSTVFSTTRIMERFFPRSSRHAQEGARQQVPGVSGSQSGSGATTVLKNRNAPASAPPHARASAHNVAVAAPSRFIFVSFAFGKVRKGEARKKKQKTPFNKYVCIKNCKKKTQNITMECLFLFLMSLVFFVQQTVH